MIHILAIIALFACAVAVQASPIQEAVQREFECGTTDNINEGLLSIGYNVTYVEPQDPSGLLQLWVKADSTLFSLVYRLDNGISCVLATGPDYTVLAE